MSNNHPYGNGYALPDGQQTPARKPWSKLAILAAVVNGALFITFVSVPMLMITIFGVDEKKGGEVSIDESNGFVLLSILTSVPIMVLSVAALIINIIFYKSMQPVPVGLQVPVAVTKEARTKRFAAALLIAFPGITLMGFATIFFSSLALMYSAGV